MATEEARQRITAAKVKGYPKAVREIVMEAVNDFGVGYRVIDGNHMRLYCGNREVSPAKINTNSPEQHILRELLPWLEEHVSGWRDREITPARLKLLKDTMDTEPKKEESPPESPSEQSWTRYITKQGNDYHFETDGTRYRCIEPGCGYVQESVQGLHLHHLRHTGEMVEMQAKGSARRKMNAEQRRAMVVQASTVLAEYFGLKVIDTDDRAELDRLRKQVVVLEERLERMTQERDEARTRLTLVKEAMKA